jgi:hypothetical protein
VQALRQAVRAEVLGGPVLLECLWAAIAAGQDVASTHFERRADLAAGLTLLGAPLVDSALRAKAVTVPGQNPTPC